MTASQHTGGEQNAIRGIVVLVVAVIIGLALLSRSSSGGLLASAEAGSAKPATSSTTTEVKLTSSTLVSPDVSATDPGSQTTHPAKNVKVIVLNASGQKGVASKNDALVKAAGFTTLKFENAAAAPSSTVYFAEGFQADADAVKRVVKLPTAAVAKAPASPVVPAAAQANVVVVLGQDYKG